MNFTYCYIDDMLVAFENKEELMDLIKQLFDRLKAYGVAIKAEKNAVLEKVTYSS